MAEARPGFDSMRAHGGFATGPNAMLMWFGDGGGGWLISVACPKRGLGGEKQRGKRPAAGGC